MQIRRNLHFRDRFLALSRNTCRACGCRYCRNTFGIEKCSRFLAPQGDLLPVDTAALLPVQVEAYFIFGGSAMDRAQCIALLQKKQQELVLQEQHRLPCRGDFSPEEVCAVKAQLGPWPRALEEAGLKPRKFDPAT